MKIISKFKDFYDYLVQDNDADITYVRKMEVINDYYDDILKKADKNIHISYYNPRYGYYNSYYKKSKNSVYLEKYIFGIYPFVYSQPILSIYVDSPSGGDELVEIMPKSLTDKLINYSVFYTDIANEIKSLINKAVSNKPYLNVSNIQFSIESFAKNINYCVWKIKCPDIFYKLKAPVFTKYYCDLFFGGAYWDNLSNHSIGTNSHIHYITNISFQKLNHNIVKYWSDDIYNINTYINIENFLWSMKQEPTTNPDNKTKIISHGFDLKTSFRKMQ